MQLKNFAEKNALMRHADIKENFSIEIKHLRDLNNVLGFLTKEEHEEVLFSLNEDTIDQVCKYHNISKKDAVIK